MSEPRLVRLEPGDRVALRTMLLGSIERAMLMLANLDEVGFDPDHPRGAVVFGAFVDEGLVGAVAHYGMNTLISVAPPELAGDLARAAVAASGRPVLGVLGVPDEVAAIAVALALPTGEAAGLDEAEGLYRLDLCDLQVPPALTAGQVRGRALAADEVEFVTAWMVDYEREALAKAPTPESRANQLARNREALGRDTVWLLERDGELLARTEFTGRVAEGVQIGGVYTPAAQRGRGYARCVLASHLLAARAAGVETAVLFTGDANLPARRAYASLGFTRVGDYRLLMMRDPVVVNG
jgi:uncharacterized protein